MFVPAPIRLRPTRFDEVVGQEANVQILKNALKYGGIASSYAFHGPPGVGKTTVARILAAALNCRVADKPCVVCDSCQDVATGRSELVMEVDAASDRGVAMVENLQQISRIQVPEARCRVFILDEAHQLSSKAWAAFLKVIEEPPEHNVFIFVTSDLTAMPKAVRGRSSIFTFRPIPHSQIEAVLSTYDYGRPIPDGIFTFIASVAAGSLRDALKLTEQALLLEDLTLANVQAMLGLDYTAVRRLAAGLTGGRLDILLDALTYAESIGMVYEEIADMLLGIARDILLVHEGCGGPAVSGLEAEEVKTYAARISHETAWRLLHFTGGLVERRRPIRRRIDIELAYMKYLFM